MVGPGGEWAARGTMCDPERGGFLGLSGSRVGTIVARVWHEFVTGPITDSISSVVPVYLLREIALMSRISGVCLFRCCYRGRN